MAFETINQLFAAYIAGDPDAVSQGNAILDLASEAQAARQVTPEQQRYLRAASALEYERKVRAMAAAENLDHCLPGTPRSEPDYVEAAKKLDEVNRAKYPAMDEIARTRHTLEQVAAKKGAPEDADTAAWIAEQRRRRDPFAEREDVLDFNEEQTEEDEETRRWSADIQEMKAQREQQQRELAEKATARRDEKPARIRRYAEHTR